VIFDQAEYALRCEWGAHGVAQLAAMSDVLIVVDVLSFSTAVDVAVSNGAVVFPYGSRDDRMEEYARAKTAGIAEKVRTQSGFSLSPASLKQVPAGFRLVLPSPNGAALSLAGGGTVTFTACLRNAGAVARAARQCGSTFAVVPAGERWPDGSLRPAIEDWIGVGAVLARLPGCSSPEAAMAIAAFESVSKALGAVLERCSSGKELIDRGFAEDVALAAELDVSTIAPRLQDGGFVGQATGLPGAGHRPAKPVGTAVLGRSVICPLSSGAATKCSRPLAGGRLETLETGRRMKSCPSKNRRRLRRPEGVVILKLKKSGRGSLEIRRCAPHFRRRW
jgi:2-phosphosulfolactate phosphatase